MTQCYREEPFDTEREVRELVGKCLWDIFSDNHDVVGSDGRVVDIGSFRGAGGFIAESINRRTGRHEYDYLDFYLGTIWIAQRADLTPVYRMIFRRLKARGHDWAYSFPQLGLLDLRPLRGMWHEPTESAGDDVSPASGFASEEDEERDRASVELRESLDASHRQAVEDARQGPPPKPVQAYHSVYGRFPQGWPPVP